MLFQGVSNNCQDGCEDKDDHNVLHRNQNQYKEDIMVRKRILVSDRVRQVNGSFAFIPHRFLSGGFLASLSRVELLLYFFLVVASDRYGLSYYGRNSICSILNVSEDEYCSARDQLIAGDLIAFNGSLFQVLELPASSVREGGIR